MTPQDELKTAINTIIKSTEEEKDNNFEESLRLSENDKHEALQLIPKAITLVTKAIEEDNNENYEDALWLYETGVKYFLNAIKDESLDSQEFFSLKEKIRKNIKNCGETAEEIREHLEKFNVKELDNGPHAVFLGKGIYLVTKAVEEDANKNYEHALRLYEEGIEHLAYALKNEAEAERYKEYIQNKTKEYDKRAEKIRKYLEEKCQGLDNESESNSDNEDENFNKKNNQCCWIC